MSSDVVGQVLGGRYSVLHPIARGGMGAVYEARDERLGRRVALKVLLDELAHDPTCAERFRREARAVAAVTHPSLVSIHDLSLDTSPAFLVMELVEGPSLRDVLASEGRVQWRRALGLIADVLDALASLHAAGIVHRDLKPANVLVTRAGAKELAKVIDLGVAQLTTGEAFQRLTASGAAVGTPAYMSPEQLAGARVGPAADIWGAGVLLYMALTGLKPFDGGHIAELLTAVHEREPTPLAQVAPEVPREVAVVLETMLTKDPSRRPSSAAEVAAAMRALLAGEFVEARDLPRADTRASQRATSYEGTPRRAERGAAIAQAAAAPPGDKTRALKRSSSASSLAAIFAALGVLTTCAVGIAIAALVISWRSAAEPAASPSAPVISGYDTGPSGPTGLPAARSITVLYSGPDGAAAESLVGATLSPRLIACIPDPSLHPLTDRIVYLVRVDGAGAVLSVESSRGGATTQEDACIREALQSARFPPPSTSYRDVTVVLAPTF